MKPETDLDFGLEPLGNDQDILNLLKYTTRYKLIKLYIEHGFTTLTTYFKSPKFSEVVIEEIIGEGPHEVNTSGKTSTCKKRLCLEWYGTGEEVVGPVIGEHGPVIGEHEVGDTTHVVTEKIPEQGPVMGEHEVGDTTHVVTEKIPEQGPVMGEQRSEMGEQEHEFVGIGEFMVGDLDDFDPFGGDEVVIPTIDKDKDRNKSKVGDEDEASMEEDNMEEYGVGPMNMDEFGSSEDSDFESGRKRRLRKLRKVQQQTQKPTNTNFYVRGSKLSRVGKTVTCAKCKKRGHNSRSCKGQEERAT